MRRMVFDLDCTLESPHVLKNDYERFKRCYRDHFGPKRGQQMVLEWIYKENLYCFFAYPGAFELLQWVHSQNIAIDFFSSALHERNLAVSAWLMQSAFGDDAPAYRVFSGKEHGCDTRTAEGRCKYIGFFYGLMKKKLEGVVVKAGDLPDCLLVDDDRSYSAKGEEANLVTAPFSGLEGRDYLCRKLTDRDDENGDGLELYHCFYYAGLLDELLQRADDKKIPLREAAIEVQYWDEGLKFPPNPSDRRPAPFPHSKDARYYLSGLKLLQRFNPALSFLYGIEDSWWTKDGIDRERYELAKRWGSL